MDILDVDPSRSEGDKVVIVFNSIQLDEMKTMVRSMRTHQRHQELLEQGVREMRAQLSELQRLQARVVILERKVEEQDGQHSEHPSPQRSRRRNESDFTAEPPPKRARTKPGRPDAKIQDAFLELLRAGFGIDSNEGWPYHPNVSRDSPDWPRHIPIANDAVAAAKEGELVGEPMDRLDWMEGRLDDRQFKAILSKHTRTIMEKADEFDLPDAENVRTQKYIYAACHRSLEWLKRTCRQKREVGDAAMKEKKDANRPPDQTSQGAARIPPQGC
ncbi:hypothetical protein A4X06_0g8295 [Tilletia controversa]|uniref:Uncharacterized protein n=1 Tax=Tilletia controversa TaxID=13291 RepID=A0A8X7MK94_9BASI|nr:hypothetical protein A4X06_0g8295 [Tilletia controversa]